jgi:hypothetical protein
MLRKAAQLAQGEAAHVNLTITAQDFARNAGSFTVFAQT